MVRKGEYKPWSSKNCTLLWDAEDNDLAGIIDWRDTERPTTLDDLARWNADLMKDHKTGDPLPQGLILGRPHREEAILVQLKGEKSKKGKCDNKCANEDGIFASCRVTGLHRGACGNCIWQSKAMECSHALAAIEQEAARKERLAKARQSLLDSKDAINSSKRTAKTIARQTAKAAPTGLEPPPSATKKRKTRK